MTGREVREALRSAGAPAWAAQDGRFPWQEEDAEEWATVPAPGARDYKKLASDIIIEDMREMAEEATRYDSPEMQGTITLLPRQAEALREEMKLTTPSAEGMSVDGVPVLTTHPNARHTHYTMDEDAKDLLTEDELDSQGLLDEDTSLAPPVTDNPHASPGEQLRPDRDTVMESAVEVMPVRHFTRAGHPCMTAVRYLPEPTEGEWREWWAGYVRVWPGGVPPLSSYELMGGLDVAVDYRVDDDLWVGWSEVQPRAPSKCDHQMAAEYTQHMADQVAATLRDGGYQSYTAAALEKEATDG